MDAQAITNFRHTFDGDIFEPSDSGYDEARYVFESNGNPSLVAQPKTPHAIAQAISYARQHNLELSIKSGGHSGSGFSTNDDGLVIDMKYFNQIEILNLEAGIVRIGSGARWGDVATTLGEHNLAITSGDTSTVGVGGLTLGGGIGWMVRKHGLTIDQLLEAEIVTADGQILTTNADQNPDLFWALRGGGGNFGVVTRFTFQAQPNEGIIVTTILYDHAKMWSILPAVHQAMLAAPKDLTGTLVVPPVSPDGQPILMLVLAYAGTGMTAAQAAVSPLISISGHISHDTKAMQYADILDEKPRPSDDVEIVATNVMVKDGSPEFYQTLEKFCASVKNPMLIVRYLGGAFGEVAEDATAFSYRDSSAVIVVGLMLDASRADLQIEKQRIAENWSTLEPFTNGVYINFMNTGDGKAIGLYKDDTYRRLADIKQRYDPENTFRRNYNIDPSTKPAA